MNPTINEIRTLLDKLEAAGGASPAAAAMRVFSGLELPDILRDVIDLLAPSLKPYELSYYLYFLRHSILETGSPHIRLSKYRLQSGVIKSPYADTRSGGKSPDDDAASFATVQRALRGLEDIGAIRKEGEPNRDGTLYRVLLPEEIEVCQRAKADRDRGAPVTPVDQREVDHYNVRENRMKVYERDSYKCRYCGKQLTRFTATLDHVKPIAEGGDNSLENLITACLTCNSKKNARLLGDFVAETNPS